MKKILACFLLSFQISRISGCSSRQEKISDISSDFTDSSISSETEIETTYSKVSAGEEVVLTQTSEEFLPQTTRILSDSPSFSSRFSVIESSKFLIIVSPSEDRLTQTIQPSQTEASLWSRRSSQLKYSQSLQLDETITSSLLLSTSLISSHLAKETISFTQPQQSSSITPLDITTTTTSTTTSTTSTTSTTTSTTTTTTTSTTTTPSSNLSGENPKTPVIDNFDENNSSDDSQISNTDLFLGVEAESDTNHPDLLSWLDVVNNTVSVTDTDPVNLPLRAETLTDDESISLFHSPTTSDYADYSVEIFENIISPHTQERNKLNPGNFETTTESRQPSGQTIWDSLNSFNEINEDLYREEEFREFSDHQITASTDRETTTFSPDPPGYREDDTELSLPSNVNYTTWKQVDMQQLNDGSQPAEMVPKRNNLVVTEATVVSDYSDLRKKDRTISGLQYFGLGPTNTIFKKPQKREKKPERFFQDLIDNEISDTKVDKVKIQPGDDIGKEVSVTINITEYSAGPHTARQDYSAPAPAPAPAPGSSASLPASCYTSTTCTASCGPGFQLVIPNTGNPECQTGVLQVWPHHLKFATIVHHNCRCCRVTRVPAPSTAPGPAGPRGLTARPPPASWTAPRPGPGRSPSRRSEGAGPVTGRTGRRGSVSPSLVKVNIAHSNKT